MHDYLNILIRVVCTIGGRIQELALQIDNLRSENVSLRERGRTLEQRYSNGQLVRSGNPVTYDLN